MKFDILHNFISPVTGRVLADFNYVLVGNRQGIATASPILIDIRLDLINLRKRYNTLVDADFIVGHPNDQIPNAQVLVNLADGYMFNTAGIVSTTATIPIGTLPNLTFTYLWTGNIFNRPIEVQNIILANMADLTFKRIWRGNLIDRPIESDDLTTVETDLSDALSQIANLASLLASLASAVSALQSIVAGLEAGLASVGGWVGIALLQTQVLGLIVAIAATNARIDALRLNNISADADVSLYGFKIINLANPINPQDAATKFYVDSAIGGGAAPINATYIIQTADVLLTNAQVLASLSTGLVKNTTTTGVLSIGVPGTDYYSPDHPTTLIDTALISNNTGMGYQIFNVLTTGLFNAAFGTQTLTALTTGQQNSGFGNKALLGLTTGSKNTASGSITAPHLVSGDNNSFFGAGSGFSMTSGDQNCVFGTDAFPNVTSGSNRNSVFGYNAAQNQNTYNSCIFLGPNADASVNNLSNAIAIGDSAVVGADNSMVLGNGVNVGIGTSTPAYLLDVIGTIRSETILIGTGTFYVGFQAGSLTSNILWTLPVTDSTGTQALVSNGSGVLSWSNSLSGDAPANATYIIQTTNASLTNAQVLASLTSGLVKNTTTTGVLSIATAGTDYYSPGHPTTLIDDFNLNGSPPFSYGNVGVGTLALFSLILNSATNTGNTALGSEALYSFTTGADNTAIGQSSLFSFVSGSDNTAVGLGSGYNMISGDRNCIFGSNALPNITSGSNDNSVFGWNAAQNQTNYTNCLFLGVRADASVNNLTNAIAIGASSSVGASNSMVLGNGVNVGIGTSTPVYLLDVIGITRTSSILIGTGTFHVGFQAGSLSSNILWTLPVTDSTGTQALVSNGSGVLSWQTPTTGTITSIGTGYGVTGGPITSTGTIVLDLTAVTERAYCRVATTANLTATYSNGSSGVGATLTNSGTQVALSIDGVALSVSDRVLVKNQSTTFQNGIYFVTTVGTGSTNWVLTRSVDFNGAISGSIAQGITVWISQGTINTETLWMETGAGPFTIGTTAITFSGYPGQTSITNLGTVTTGTWNGSIVDLAHGGSNANLTAVNAGVVYSTASAMAISAAPSVTNEILMGQVGGAPVWSAATYPSNVLPGQLLYGSGLFAISGLATAANGILVTNNSDIPSILAGPGVANQIILSGVSTSPTWSTATYPATTTINQLLYSSATNTIVGLATANSGVLITNSSGVPSISSTLPLISGGANAALTASNGGIVYSTASALSVLAGTATANQILLSGSSGAPSWSTATHPATTTVNQLLYSSATNVISGLATANSAVLLTNGSGVPAWQTLTSSAVTSITGTTNQITASASTGAVTLSMPATIVITNAIGIGSGANAPLQFAAVNANRKIVFIEVANNDHQVTALGAPSNGMRLQVPDTGKLFIFNAGTSTTTSQELMRVTATGTTGNSGCIGINVGTTPLAGCHVIGGVQNVSGEDTCFRAESANSNAKIEIDCTNGSGRLYEIRSSSAGTFDIVDRTGSAEKIVINTTGVGISSAPSFLLDVFGTARTQKLIANAHTPTNSLGAVGVVGTGAASSILGGEVGGRFTLTTGTGVLTTGTIATFTLAAAMPSSTFSVIFQSVSGGISLNVAPISSTQFTISNTGLLALAASTTYVWNYVIIGY